MELIHKLQHDILPHYLRGVDPNEFTDLAWITGIWLLGTLCITAIVDRVLLRLIFSDASTRWFALHVLFNSFIVYLTYSYIPMILLRPYETMVPEEPFAFVSQFTTTCIGAFHLYHSILFELTFEDVMHHLINTGAVVVVGVVFPFSYGLALCNFIMCGFPGGVDYALLVLVKLKWIHPMTEKHINRYLNLLIRYPGMLLCAWMFVICAVNGLVQFDAIGFLSPGVTLTCMLAGAVAHTANAAYYCDKVVGNYHVRSKSALIAKNK